MSVMQAAEFDARLMAGIRTALNRARELGYPVEQMDVTASISSGLCTIHFSPIAEPGFISSGGDLLLIIDPQAECVLECKRGQ